MAASSSALSSSNRFSSSFAYSLLGQYPRARLGLSLRPAVFLVPPVAGDDHDIDHICQ
jgi:hypothetical protein